jgi:hypothetical protein
MLKDPGLISGCEFFSAAAENKSFVTLLREPYDADTRLPDPIVFRSTFLSKADCKPIKTHEAVRFEGDSANAALTAKNNWRQA